MVALSSHIAEKGIQLVSQLVLDNVLISLFFYLIGRARCSHFLSICYVANAMFKNKRLIGAPCPNGCSRNPGLLASFKPNYYHFGQDTPDE
jgi:hypothetical protein